MSRARPALVAAVLVASLVACGGGSGGGEAAGTDDAPAVRTAAVAVVELGRSLRLPGIVKPERRAVLSTRTSGTVKSVSVAAGDAVEAGQTLLEVESRDLEAGLEAARLRNEAASAALDKARLDVERLERLYADELVALSRLEDARLLEEQRQAEVSAAQAALRARQVGLDYARVEAPFGGTVSEVLVDPGAFVGPGTPLLVLEARRGFEVDASVTQEIADGLSPGQAVTVVLPGADERYRGVLQAVIPALEGDGAGSVARLSVEQDAAGFRPGQVVEVVLPLPGEPQAAWQVPAEAVFRRGQLHGVFVAVGSADGSRAELRWIRLDPDSAERAEAGHRLVLEGLAAGERVVVGDVVQELKDGQAIRLADEGREGPGS